MAASRRRSGKMLDEQEMPWVYQKRRHKNSTMADKRMPAIVQRNVVCLREPGL